MSCTIKSVKDGRKFEVWSKGAMVLRTKYRSVAEDWVTQNHAADPKPVLKASVKPVNPADMP